MFKKPTWLRAVRDGVVDYSVLNKLLLPNMTHWFSYTHSSEMTLCAEIRPVSYTHLTLPTILLV